MGWIFLLLASAFEIGFTYSLKMADGFKNWKWTIAFVVCYLSSALLLSKAISWGEKPLPLGTAYAIWTGIGAVGTIIIGIVFFKEPASFWRLFFLFTLVASIVGLKIVTA